MLRWRKVSCQQQLNMGKSVLRECQIKCEGGNRIFFKGVSD